MRRLAAIASVLACAAALQASVRVPMDVRRPNNMHLADGRLNGIPCRLLVDTGATHTSFDLGFVTNRFPQAELQEVEVLGTTNVRTMPRFLPCTSFSLGGHAFAARGVMVIPLDGLAASVGERVDGILGMSDLSSADFILRDEELVFDPSEEDLKGFGVGARKGGDALRPFVSGLHDGREIPFLVDSGSTYTFVKEGLWKPSTNELSLTTTEISGKGGLRPTIGVEGTLVLGIPLTLSPMISDHEPNYLGADVLKGYDILFRARGQGISFRPR